MIQRAFVSGGSGFIGKALVAGLRSRGIAVCDPTHDCWDLVTGEWKVFDDSCRWNPTPWRRNVDTPRLPGVPVPVAPTLRPDCSPMMDQFDVIYHLAAHARPGDYCLDHPAELWEQNTLIHATMLRWWREAQPQALFVTVGSSCAYEYPAPDERYPHREEHYLLGQPAEDLYPYAMTKRMLLIGLQAYARQYGLEYLYFILPSIYGPGYDVTRPHAHFVVDIARKLLTRTQTFLFGSGEQRREAFYLPDLVKVLIDLTDQRNLAMNVAVGFDLSLKDWVKEIGHVIGPAGVVVWNRGAYSGVDRKRMDGSRFRSVYPDLQLTPVTEALRATVDDLLRRLEMKDAIAN